MADNYKYITKVETKSAIKHKLVAGIEMPLDIIFIIL